MRWGTERDKSAAFALDACYGILPTWQACSEVWGKYHIPQLADHLASFYDDLQQLILRVLCYHTNMLTCAAYSVASAMQQKRPDTGVA